MDRETAAGSSPAEAVFGRALSMTVDAAVVRDLDSDRYVAVNDEFVRLVGYPRHEIRGKKKSELPIWLDLEEQGRLQEEARTEGAIRDREVWLRRADGRKILAQVSAQVLEIEGASYAISFVRDITERRRLEESLRLSECQYRELVEAIRGIVWRGDAKTFQILYVSQEAERLLGYPAEQWLREPSFWVDHLHPDDRESTAALCLQAAAEGRPHELEYRMIAADGRVVWLRDVVRTVPSGVHTGQLAGVMIDIAARKQAEEALARSEAKFRHLTEQSLDIISRHSTDGFILYVSPACRDVLGHEPHEMIGHSCLEFVHPDDVERIKAAIFVGLESWDSQFVAFRTRRHDGTYAWMEASFRSVRDSQSGAPIELVAVSRDVTERRKVERMRQDVVAMLSHDVKTPLSVILGCAQLLRTATAGSTELKDITDTVEASAQTAFTLTMNFLDAERAAAGSFAINTEELCVNDLVEEVLGHQQRRACARGMELKARLDPQLPPTPLDVALISRAITNLVSNAIEFSPPKATIEVETALCGDRVRLAVRDRGRGIPPEKRPLLFQRYSSLAAERESTGLGLFIVKTIMDAHRGEVSASFPPEGGSEFAIWLPTRS